MLIIAVTALVVLAFLDQACARVVANQMAARAQRRQDLPERPVVALGGFPFLTQVVRGRYRGVDVQVRGYASTGPRVDRVRAELDGVRVSLPDVLRGRVNRVAVRRVHAEVELTFADMDAYLRGRGSAVRVRAEGDAVRVSGAVRLLGVSYPLSGTADIGVLPDAVTVTPRELTQGFGALLPPAVRGVALALLTVTFPVASLPPAMELISATVHPDRLTVTAGGEHVVLDMARLRPAGGAAQQGGTASPQEQDD